MLLLALTEQFHDDSVARSPRRARRSRPAARRLRARLLHRDRRRAPGQGAAPARHARLRPAGLRMAAGRDELGTRRPKPSVRPATTMRVLRWNACARLIMRDRHLVPIGDERGEPLLLE